MHKTRTVITLTLLSFCILAFSTLATQTKAKIIATHKAIIETDLGSIEIELYGHNAPKTVQNFIGYIQAGAFDKGSFYRVVRQDNDNGSPKIEVIQAGARAEFNDFAAIELENTQLTGINHLDGVLSMARGAPNSATSAFFICIGPQPSLDFAGKRNPDGLGFAAFAKVVKGMQVVHQIHQIRKALAVDDPYVKDQILAEPVGINTIKLIDI
ncbi:peptidylprolyl isomerase [Paraglaciecola aestuariivivens]